MGELHAGLDGIVVAETQISSVDGERGSLIYRGHWTEELVKRHHYEEIVYLLWHGRLPDEAESRSFRDRLVGERELSLPAQDMIKKLSSQTSVMSMLRTVVSSLIVSGEAWPPTIDQAITILVQVPLIIAYYYACSRGEPPRESDPSLSHSANYLYLLTGKSPTPMQEKALDVYLMLAADHGMNASTFTARVVTSTESDIVSAMVAAIGALMGPLHGGAPSKVDDMLEAIGHEENAEPWLRTQLENNVRLMGFGHRVYKTYDPRAAALRHLTAEFAEENELFRLALHVEQVAIRLLKEYKPERHLYPNLEFWAAGVLRTIELPRELYTPTFCMARVAGWSAHVFEQAENNRLIRPESHYVGPHPEE